MANVRRLTREGLARLVRAEARRLRESRQVDSKTMDILVDALVDAMDLTQLEGVIMDLSADGVFIGADPTEVADAIMRHPRLREQIVGIATEVTTDYGR